MRKRNAEIKPQSENSLHKKIFMNSPQPSSSIIQTVAAWIICFLTPPFSKRCTPFGLLS